MGPSVPRSGPGELDALGSQCLLHFLHPVCPGPPAGEPGLQHCGYQCLRGVPNLLAVEGLSKDGVVHLGLDLEVLQDLCDASFMLAVIPLTQLSLVKPALGIPPPTVFPQTPKSLC